MATLAQPYLNAALKATKQQVKAVPGVIVGWHIQNLDSTQSYLQLYDALSANVTVGTTPATLTLWLPASGGLEDWSDTNVKVQGAIGLFEFATGLTIAATTTIAGSTNPTNGLLTNLRFV